MEIRPDRRLFTRQWLFLLSMSFWIALLGLVLQVLIPLGEETPARVAAVLWPVTGGVIALMWIIAVPLIVLWIRSLRYVIGEERITIHKGILTKIQQNIPYRAITDFMVHRSLFDRFLGIGSIRVQTAGQSTTATGYEGQLSGLLEWEALHEDLRVKLKALHGESLALGIAEPAATETADVGLQRQVLEELRAIRRALERR